MWKTGPTYNCAHVRFNRDIFERKWKKGGWDGDGQAREVFCIMNWMMWDWRKPWKPWKIRRKIGISDHFSKKSFFGQQILGGGGEGNGGIQRRRWRRRRRRRCHHSGTTKQGKIVLLSQCMDHGKLRWATECRQLNIGKNTPLASPR